MDININKDCSCICPNEIKYSCDANGLCYQDDNGQYYSVEECINASKAGYCGKFIRLSSNYLPWNAPANFIVGNLSLTNNPYNIEVIYSLEDSGIFIDNNNFIIENNTLKFISNIPYFIKKTYNVYIKAVIDGIEIFELFNIDVTPDSTFYEIFVETGSNIAINTTFGFSLTFENIINPGLLLIQNYKDDNTYIFDISTSASYSGNIAICIKIPDDVDINTVNISHFNQQSLVNFPITSIDHENRVVCGVAESLSSFIVNTFSSYKLSDIVLDTENLISNLSNNTNQITIIYDNDNFINDIDTTNLIGIECPSPQTPGVTNIIDPFSTETCGCWDSLVTLASVINKAKNILVSYSKIKNKLIGIDLKSDNIKDLQSNITSHIRTKKIAESLIALSKKKLISYNNKVLLLNNQINDIEDQNIKDNLILELNNIQLEINNTLVNIDSYIQIANNSNNFISALDIEIDAEIYSYNQFKQNIFADFQNLYNSYNTFKSLENFIVPKICANGYIIDLDTCQCIENNT